MAKSKALVKVGKIQQRRVPLAPPVLSSESPGNSILLGYRKYRAAHPVAVPSFNVRVPVICLTKWDLKKAQSTG